MSKTNILLTGHLNNSVWTLAEKLRARRFNVTVAAKALTPENKNRNISYIPLADIDADLPNIYKTGGFQTVIYFFSWSSEWTDALGEEENSFGNRLDMLKANLGLLDLFPEVTKFILVTDQRVFGMEQEKTELTRPVPDTYIGRMIRLAEVEFLKKKRSGVHLEKLLIRTTHLYENRETEGVFGSFSGSAEAVRFSGDAEHVCDLLSWRDFSTLLVAAVESDQTGTVHAYQGKGIAYTDLALWFSSSKTGFVATGERKDKNLLTGDAAFERYEWVAEDYFLNETNGTVQEKTVRKAHDLQKLIREQLGRLTAPLELCAGFVIMQFLVKLTGTYTTFRIVDVRLLFPVIIGTVHGAVWGLIAAIASYISYCISYLSLGGEFWDLLLNMDNWLPLIMYLLAGEITGYIRTVSKEREIELEEELAHKNDTLDFMRRLHQSTCDQRDMLREQVVNSQDSYGKVYSMISEMDLLNPDEISFRAIHIMEKVLNCKTITIFYRLNEGKYLRKIAESSEVKLENTPYSLNLDEYPAMRDSLNKGEIYVNKELDASMPSYAIEQPMGEHLSLVVVLWKVEYRQYSKYFQNLLIVTTSLISHSMKKAVEFMYNNNRYIPGTILLKHDEFIKAWQIRRQMQLEQMGSYVLFRVASSLPDHVLSERLKECTRNLDIAGKTNDGCRYLLLMQADERFAPMLSKRLESKGIAAELIDDNELNIYL